MIWFRRTNRPVNRRVREVKQELRELEREIRRIQTSSPNDTEVTPNSSPPLSETSDRQSAAYSPPSTNPVRVPPGVQPRHALSSREMDFFAPTEKGFIHDAQPAIHLKPETPQPETTPSHAAAPPPVAARISPNQSRERLAFYLRSGTVQTLKPLRYERRVARNRTIAWVVIAAVMIFLCVHFSIILIKSCHH